MLSLLLVVLSLNLEAILGFIYVDTPKSRSDAQKYCQYTYGTDLATIVNPKHRRMAIRAIKRQADAVWIGMKHEKPMPNYKYPCHFTYPDDDDYPNICPNYPYDWKCVDFWCNDKPKLLNKGGYECVTYKWNSRNKHGGVDNCDACDTKLPFLCDKPDEICDVENSICGRVSLFPLLPFTFCACLGPRGSDCDPNPWQDCVCDRDANGESRCVDHWVKCRGRTRCKMSNNNAECPSGEVCVATTCCSRKSAVCLPLCGEDAKPRRLLQPQSNEEFEADDLCDAGIYDEEVCGVSPIEEEEGDE